MLPIGHILIDSVYNPMHFYCSVRQAEPYSNRDPSELKFSYIAGVINMDDRSRFERQLFRSTRGNCYIRFTEIEQTLVDPK